MYEDYADKAGFATRLSTVKKKKGEITHRYIVCNKSGKPSTNDTVLYGISKTPGNIKVTGCSARIKFKVIPGTSTYTVYEFVEPHNHELLEAENKELTKARQRLQCRKQLMSNPNFRRDVSEFVGDADAQMLVDRLNKAKRTLPNFSFDYSCVGSELAFLFWADEIAKINFDAFGDVLAINVTYGTNKYKMVFVSFTGFDHHKKCVIFGGGLLSSEATESYNLLL
ncbi:putative transcription factor FAR family [Helianthus annuus]|nr:putative transcription factor FAR family [Helianthus annuus]